MVSFQNMNSNKSYLQYLIGVLLFWFITTVIMLYSIYFLSSKPEIKMLDSTISLPDLWDSTVITRNQVNFPKESSKNETNQLFKNYFIGNETVNSSIIESFKKLDVIDLTSLSQESSLQLHTEISDIFADLKHLYLAHNSIEQIKETLFQNLYNLRTLDLSNNNLIEIQSNTFEKLTKLNILGLNNNKLKTINNDTFRNNVGLKWLFLGGNFIQSLDAAHFVTLRALVLLDLSNNTIMTIQNQTFGKLENLVTLNLTKNSLTSINSNMFMGCNKLSQLIMDRSALNEVITFAYGRKNKQNEKEKSFFAYSI